jgi:hypothetical protein
VVLDVVPHAWDVHVVFVLWANEEAPVVSVQTDQLVEVEVGKEVGDAIGREMGKGIGKEMY